MKKSRIIIPALAMIAFSVAASVTGTVAWFTARRTAGIDAGTYAVVKTTANLDCKVTAGVGTTATNNAAGTDDLIRVKDGEKLTDGSFDHDAEIIFAPDQTGEKVGKRTALASASESELARGQTTANKNIYTAVTWKVEFSLEFGQAGGDIGLYLDLANSVFTPADTSDTGAYDTSKGFRMAFIPGASTGTGANANNANGTKRVFADLEASAKCTYIKDNEGAPAVNAALPSGSAYTAPALIANGVDTAIDAGGYTESASASMVNYLGKFSFSAGATVKLDYTVVCWFEGTDENIVNGNTTNVTVFRDVSAALSFQALNFKAA